MASWRFRLRQEYWKWIAPRQIGNYIRSHQPRSLQIGTGPNPLAGWLNTTLYPFASGTIFMDASLAFPIPSACFDYVFSEHVIEHLEFEQATSMLAESFRILKSGGRIRIATPDLARIIALYTQPEGEAQSDYSRWIMENFRPQVEENFPAHVINQSFYGWRHKFIYDQATLAGALAVAGFHDIERVPPGESNDERLQGIEQHGDYVGSEQSMRYETMVLEGTKP